MSVTCAHCGERFEADTIAPGDRHQCEHCGRVVTYEDVAVSTGVDETTAVEQFPQEGDYQPGDRIAQYLIVRKIGEGGFGTVYLALDTALERNVAIKIPKTRALPVEDVKILLREARITASLRHPNIVPVYEAGTIGDVACIVSDYINGPSLAKWYARHRPGLESSVRLCAQLADAVESAHQESVVHRDLKPTNILIDEKGVPHITDFGLAKREAFESESIAGAGHVLGTPAYMSPEQARGDSHSSDRRADVYSLGVILYELTVGTRPFTGSGADVLKRVREGDFEKPREANSDIPEELEQIILHAMSVDRNNRFETAGAFRDALHSFLSDDGTQPSSNEKTPNSPMMWLAVGLLAVLAFALLIWWNPFAGARSTADQGASENNDPSSSTWTVEALLDYARPPTDTSLFVRIESDPPGARVAVVPIEKWTGDTQAEHAMLPESNTPVEMWLEPGEYVIEAEVPDFGFHQVRRTVPEAASMPPGIFAHRTWLKTAERRIEWTPIEINRSMSVKPQLIEVPGGEFAAGRPGHAGNPPRNVQVASYLITQSEITVAQYQAACGRLPTTFPELTPGEIAAFGDHPVTHVSFDEAMHYAEIVGMRLPTATEWEYAATNLGRSTFPWGNDSAPLSNWYLDGSVFDNPYDRAQFADADPPVIGLFSGVTEWTATIPQFYDDDGQRIVLPEMQRMEQLRNRVVRGGPSELENGPVLSSTDGVDPRMMFGWPTRGTSAAIGIRAVKDLQPRYLE